MVDKKKRFQSKGATKEFVGEAQFDDTSVMAVLEGRKFMGIVYISPESITNNHCFWNMLLNQTYTNKILWLWLLMGGSLC